MKYPWRATDYIRELFDELARAGDNFVGLLLCGVSADKDRRETQTESTHTALWGFKWHGMSKVNTLKTACRGNQVFNGVNIFIIWFTWWKSTTWLRFVFCFFSYGTTQRNQTVWISTILTVGNKHYKPTDDAKLSGLRSDPIRKKLRRKWVKQQTDNNGWEVESSVCSN